MTRRVRWISSLSFLDSLTFWFFFAANLIAIIRQTTISSLGFVEKMRWGTYLFLAVIVLLRWLQIKIRLLNMEVIAVVIFSQLIGYLIAGRGIFYFVLVGMFLQKIDERKALYYNLLSVLLIVGTVVVLALSGILNNVTYYTGGDEVHLLGFENKNAPPIWVMMIIASFNILYENRQDGSTHFLTWKMILSETVVFVVTYYLFRCRTILVVAILYMLGLTVAKTWGRRRFFTLIMNPLQYMFILLAGLSYYLAIHYESSNGHMTVWNVLLSGRLSLFSEYVTNYQIKLFGNKIVIDANEELLPFDNTYLQLLVWQGLISFVIHTLVFIFISRYAYKRKMWVLLITTVAYEINFLTEARATFSYCPVLLFALALFMNNASRGRLSNMILRT